MTDVQVKPPQTSLSKLLLCTTLIAIYLAAARVMYAYGGYFDLLSILLLGVVILGGCIGALLGGFDLMFRGIVVGLALSGISLVILALIGIIMSR
jgi:hypothetical protein